MLRSGAGSGNKVLTLEVLVQTFRSVGVPALVTDWDPVLWCGESHPILRSTWASGFSLSCRPFGLWAEREPTGLSTVSPSILCLLPQAPLQGFALHPSLEGQGVSLLTLSQSFRSELMPRTGSVSWAEEQKLSLLGPQLPGLPGLSTDRPLTGTSHFHRFW